MLRHAIKRPEGCEMVSPPHDAPGKSLAGVASLLTWGLFVIWGVLQAGAPCRGDDEADKVEREKQSKRRLEFMQSVIDDLKVSSSEIESDSALKLGKSPLLRYNDPTRGLGDRSKGLMDAGVWRLGESGRPTALVTLEIYRVQADRAILSYEFASLVPSRFAIVSPRGPTWRPTRTDLKMVRLPDVPRPADSPKARLVQMRQLLRRFSVHETLDTGDKVECRLLPQPIDRYADEKAGISDGAIFVFANGTNPELAVLLECNADDWTYGVVRLSSAALFAELDGQQFYEAPQSFGQPPSAPYLGTTHQITLDE
jgi:hypothetical protein